MGDDEPQPAVFVLGYSGFRGFPVLKIQTWETPKRPHSLLGWPIFRKKTSASTQRFFCAFAIGKCPCLWSASRFTPNRRYARRPHEVDSRRHQSIYYQ